MVVPQDPTSWPDCGTCLALVTSPGEDPSPPPPPPPPPLLEKISIQIVRVSGWTPPPPPFFLKKIATGSPLPALSLGSNQFDYIEETRREGSGGYTPSTHLVSGEHTPDSQNTHTKQNKKTTTKQQPQKQNTQVVIFKKASMYMLVSRTYIQSRAI